MSKKPLKPLRGLAHLKRWVSAALLCCFVTPGIARAEFRYGFSLGLGGTGIQKPATVASADGSSSSTKNVVRALIPGTFGMSIDYVLSQTMQLSIEQTRGFSFGPFAAGVSFTGPVYRYYYPRITPNPKEQFDTARLIVHRIVIFAGLGAGVAKGKITTLGDQVPEIEGSGLYVSYRGGLEYLINKTLGIRPEMFFSSTLFSAASNPMKLLEFSAQVALFSYF